MTLFQHVSILALAAIVGISNASDVSSHLQIHIPQQLFEKGGYDHREALFGIPHYGGKITQFVYYADDDLCDSNVNTHKGYPIRPIGPDGVMPSWSSPYILMVNRGSCTFVTKVRNAQRSGAAGVIIADNSCLCSAADLCTSARGVDCEAREPIMADDGSGSDISIPAFLMFKQDADKVKVSLMSGNVVQMEMAWALPAPDDRVEYDLWTMPTEQVSRDFLRTFQDAAIALGDRAYFTPHMYIYDGVKSNCVSFEGENQCYNLCTNNGRYCSTDPDNDLDKGISGADVVVESLRRICIWKEYGQDDGVGVEWWNYVNEFMFRCDTPEFFTNKNCIKDVYTHSGIDKDKIESCMVDSGGVDDDSKNLLLAQEIEAKDKVGVVILPALYVNRVIIRGALEVQTVFGAVCSGFVAGTEPAICIECLPCPDQLSCTANGSCSSSHAEANSVSKGTFAGSMSALIAFFLLLIFIQYQRQQSRIHDQVRGIVAEYMPLENNKELSTEIS